MEKAYAYLRVSSTGQTTGHGFARQIKTIKAWASKSGFEVAGIFREEGVSGTKDETDRPAFREMLAAILANGTKTVIVESLDRLARSYAIQESLLVYLASKGVTLINAASGEDVTEAINSDPLKRALVQMQGVFAELEKNMLVRKLRTAREAKRKATGKCEGRKGYSETQEGQTILRQLRAYRGKGFTFQQIADRLNERGVKTITGKVWTLHQVRAALL